MIVSTRDVRIGYEEGNEGEGRCKLSLYPLAWVNPPHHPLPFLRRQLCMLGTEQTGSVIVIYTTSPGWNTANWRAAHPYPTLWHESITPFLLDFPPKLPLLFPSYHHRHLRNNQSLRKIHHTTRDLNKFPSVGSRISVFPKLFVIKLLPESCWYPLVRGTNRFGTTQADFFF